MIDVCTTRLTRAQYDALSPGGKGYACYMQAAWPGSEIPDVNPYPAGSPEAAQFAEGQQAAVIETLDVDD